MLQRVLPLAITALIAVGVGLVAGKWYFDQPRTVTEVSAPEAEKPALTDSATADISSDSTQPARGSSIETSDDQNDALALAEQAYAAGDYAQVIKHLTPLAEQGDSLALYRLGLMHVEGIGVEINTTQALDYLNKAVVQGSSQAKPLLVSLYKEQLSQPDPATGHVDVFKALANLGERDGEAVYGSYLLSGTYTEANPQAARELLLKAAEKGDFRSMSNLGYMYATGTGVEQNDTQAYEWYLRAADLGFVPAQSALALHLEHGLGVEKNRQEAIQWYLNAAAAGDANAVARIGSYIVEGIIVPPSIADGVDSVALAARRGDQDALQWLVSAADQGDTSAARAYALLLLGINHGDNSQSGSDTATTDTANETRGIEYLVRAAEGNDAQAQLVLAQRYASGAGVELSTVQAYKWANIAAIHGGENAQNTRDALVQLLTADELSNAQRQATEWYNAYQQRIEGETRQ